jgi:two-component sensor histidine kinase
MAARANPHPQAPLSLALAVVESSEIPTLLLDGGLIVIAASASFRRAFHLDTAGLPLFALGEGEWNTAELQSRLTATAGGHGATEAYEIDLVRTGRETRRLVLHARKLDHADVDNVRLLLTACDVTDARAAEKLKDERVCESDILLHEVQHRVANSLQIVASMLLLNARKVQSEESRGHLREAHQRVMSVAAVQRQMVASRLGIVELGPYFDQLCLSLGTSMIFDRDQISLAVVADDSAVDGPVSVSLGLIVTELVINAIKHAFPAKRRGKIVVDYRSTGSAWTLSVTDNGVGMPKAAAGGPHGLGVGIVEALARHLHASVQVSGADPGTTVSIVCA